MNDVAANLPPEQSQVFQEVLGVDLQLLRKLVVPLVVAIVLTVFAWPTSRLEPRDLPVGVAGPAPAADAIETKLAQQAGAFDVERYADESAARDAIEDREVYGAFVATPGVRDPFGAFHFSFGFAF